MAVWIEGESVSFAELHTRVLDLGERLHATRNEQDLDGIMPILVERTLESAIAVFSAYYAGIPFAAIDEQTPLEYANAMLESLGIHHPIWQPDNVDSASPDLLILSENKVEFPDLHPDDFAYAILTSGSAGVPKAVMHSRNSGLEARLSRFNDPKTNLYSMLATTTFSFAVGLVNLLFVSQGHSYYNLKPANHTPSEMFGHIRDLQPTHMFIPAQVARIYSKTSTEQKITSIRQVQVGGEALRFEHLRGFAQSFADHTTFHHRLGSSEALCGLGWTGTIHDMPESGQIPFSRSGNDYKLIPRLDLADDLWELYSGGGVSLGYYNNPELTQDKFVTVDGRRWWKSGDLLQEVSEDQLLHYGRIDDVVKISGHLVSPHNVVKALMSLEDVALASVMSERETDRYVLRAFVELTDSSSATLETLRNDLVALLPPYMIPQFIHIVDEIPINNRGKTDRNSLRRSQQEA